MAKEQTITDYLDSNALKLPDKAAIVFEDTTLSWRQLGEKVNIASDILHHHIPTDKQYVIGLLLPNSWQFVVAYLAMLKAGHIALPLDPTHKKMEITNVIEQIKPFLVISQDSFTEFFNSTTKVLNVDTLLNPPALSKEQKGEKREKSSSDIATLLFTSGTTGKPKAVPYTHANHIWNIAASTELWQWKEDDSLLIALPLSHWHGLVMGLSGALYHGNTLYLHERFNAEKVMEVLASGKITMFTHVSIAYFKFLEIHKDKNYDLSSIRLFISASSTLPPAVWQEFKERFGHEILECYGSSESGRLTSNSLSSRIPGSVGQPLPGVSLRLEDDNEIAIRSPGLFPGYYKNLSATKAKYTKDGWWLMGDIGVMKDGHLSLKGRVQERIKHLGYTIYPRDIEWALLKNENITDVLVMGVQRENMPDDKLIYFIVGDVSVDNVRSYTKENMPSAWRADDIFILESLPRTKSGKISLPQLKLLLE